MKKLLILSVVVLFGCTRRDLPSPEKKKMNVPVTQAPKEESQPEPEQKYTGKRQPDDPNRQNPSKVEVAPEILMGSPNEKPSGGSSAQEKAPKLRWDELITDLKLSDDAQIRTRTESVKSLLGEKADAQMAAWKSDELFKLFIGHSLLISPGENGKLSIIYSAFAPWQKQKETDRSVVELPYGKEASEAELEAGVELEFGSKNQEITAVIQKRYGKAKIQRLKGLSSDYLVTLTQEREDSKSMGLVFHADKLFGSTAPVVLIFGLEARPDLVLKEFNMVNFIDIGQEKLKSHILPLKSAIEKLPEMITKNPELMKLDFEIFGTELNKFAIQSPDGKPGFLSLLLEKMQKPSIEILSARYEELKAAAPEYAPLEYSKVIDSFDRIALLGRFNKVKIEFEKAAEYLKEADQEDPKRNLKEIIDHLASVKIDIFDVALAALLMWKEEPFVMPAGQVSGAAQNPEKIEK